MEHIKFIRKVVTLKSFINKLLRMPQRTEYIKLGSGAIAIHKVYKNKRIITVVHEVPLRVLYFKS